ncbi:MAG: agmatine deiminase family protein [candidate division Zixibacteria bacterium]|nr:agmatine deiminase family protein [candidate division Zixibacteria bacterium]
MSSLCRILIVLFACALTGSLIAAGQAEEKSLPIGLTEEEMLRLDEIGITHQSTAPSRGPVRNPAQWEPSQGVIIRYPLGIPLALVRAYSENVMVTTIVSSTYYQDQAINSYTAAGVNMSNTNWLIAATDSWWTRDYGPWFIFENNGDMGIVDHIYNRPRPHDDVIPQAIGAAWGLNVYGMDLIHSGGNHMSNGLGTSISTVLVYNENPSLSHSEVDSIMYAYLGNDYTVLDYIQSGGIHHIDCWAKMLDPTTILVKDVPTGSSSYHLLNARADYLGQQISPWGRPYTVVRVYCPYGTAYTNSLIINDKVYVPTFGSTWDDSALITFQEAMPGYEIRGFDGSWYDNDAIHCRAMGVPDSNMLFIHHVPLFDTEDMVNDYYVGVKIVDHSDAGLIMDSTKIYYDDGGGTFVSAPLFAAAYPDSFYGHIPAQSISTTVKYFIQAADLSSRIETHPYIGQAGAHQFTVTAANVPPQIIAPDSLLCKVSEEFGYYPEIVDPDDSIHQIVYANYPNWLGIGNDSLVGTACDTNLNFFFNVTVHDASDSAQAEIMVDVYMCGDVDSDNLVNIADVVAMISIIFGGSQPHRLRVVADVDCDGIFSIADVVYLINYIFAGGPPPCVGC